MIDAQGSKAARPERMIRSYLKFMGREPEPDRARYFLGDVVRALQLQELAGSSQDANRRSAVTAGAGENAGAVDIGDGSLPCSRSSRTIILRSSSRTRRRHRRRRDHPRHLHDGCAADCAAQLAAFRLPRRAGDAPSPQKASWRASPRCGNSIGIPTVGGEIGSSRLRRQPAGQCLLPGIAKASDIIMGVASGVETPSTTSAPRPAATASTARRWRRPSSTISPRRSDLPCRWAIRLMEKLLLEACLEVSADRRAGRHSGHGRRRAGPVRQPRWDRAAGRASRSTCRWSRSVKAG